LNQNQIPMETIIIQAESKKAKAIKQFLKAFGVVFKVEEPKESHYDPAFVKKIKARAKSAAEGNVVEINPDDLWGSLKLK